MATSFSFKFQILIKSIQRVDNVQNPDGWGQPVSGSGFSFPAQGDKFKILTGGLHMSAGLKINEALRGRWI